MLSSGIYFAERGRKNVGAFVVAGLLALFGTFFTIEQLIDRMLAHLQGTNNAASEIIAASILALGAIISSGHLEK